MKTKGAIRMRFSRHGGIYRSDVLFLYVSLDRSTAFRSGSAQALRTHRKFPRPTHRRDEFRPAIPQRVARQHCPSPLHRHYQIKSIAVSKGIIYHRTVNSLLTVCLTHRDNPKETVRQWMISARLWRANEQKVKAVHVWRPRRSRFGELVQWDTSEHDWLEGRGEKLYLIAMIDDATSRLFARFVRYDSTEENMKLLRSYVEKFGRPLAFYTDKASIFRTAEKHRRDEPGVEKDAVEMPSTQIGRALQELRIAWIAAHSPQAKGRVERNFATAQDRLVKGMRVAGVKTIEEANRYLDEDYLVWWEREMTGNLPTPTTPIAGWIRATTWRRL